MDNAVAIGTAVRLGGRDLTVSEVRTGKDGLPVYVLSGKRGARYATMRNAKNPALMFMINDRGFGIVGPRPVWCIVDGGTLRPVEVGF